MARADLHDYAVFGHDRVNIGRWLGFVAIIISGAIAEGISWLSAVTGAKAMASLTVTVGVVYVAANFAFTRWIWRLSFNKWGMRFSFFSIPNLNGVWIAEGKTLDEDGSSKYEWSGSIGIEQNWKEILIHLKTAQSQSYSYTATLSRRHGPTGGWLLSYSYRNEPELEHSHEMSSHFGYCEIEFDNDLRIGRAAYFNSRGRRTFGVIDLVRQP